MDFPPDRFERRVRRIRERHAYRRLLALVGQNMSMIEAFRKADSVLLNAVQGISDLMTVPGLINVDFADVRTIMAGMGRALMGTGVGSGKRRATEAAETAISSPLLEDVSIEGATGILINITGGPDLTLHEVNEASSLIQNAAQKRGSAKTVPARSRRITKPPMRSANGSSNHVIQP